MERVGVDIIGPFPHSDRGNQLILVATKWPETYALPDQEADTVAEALLEGFFCRFRVPQQLHSDQAHNFEFLVFDEMLTARGP